MKKFLLLLSAAGLVVVIWYFLQLRPVDTTDTKSSAVTIPSGASMSTIADDLEDRHLIRSAFAFKLYARLHGVAGKLQAGAFGLSPSMSVSDIAEKLRSGKTEEFLVTIPEGFSVADIDELLASKGLGQKGDIIDCAFRCDFSTFDFLPVSAAQGGEALAIGSRLEGYLFPETYSVSAQDYVPKFFIERMLGTFRKRILEKYNSDIAASGYSLHEVVTMASLVEEESRKGDERAVVAGILWKRLESRVVLGVDATTRYRVSKKTEALTKADLEIQSGYSTRRSQGLPPSPITNAGESSFVASLKPTTSPYWYYLHGNDGVIHYAVTNDEHNQNKVRYLR